MKRCVNTDEKRWWSRNAQANATTNRSDEPASLHILLVFQRFTQPGLKATPRAHVGIVSVAQSNHIATSLPPHAYMLVLAQTTADEVLVQHVGAQSESHAFVSEQNTESRPTAKVAR